MSFKGFLVDNTWSYYNEKGEFTNSEREMHHIMYRYEVNIDKII